MDDELNVNVCGTCHTMGTHKARCKAGSGPVTEGQVGEPAGGWGEDGVEPEPEG